MSGPGKTRSALAAIAATALLSACSNSGETGPINVSMIGSPPGSADPNRGPVTPAGAVTLASVAQGLVSFGPQGEIVPALASRWIMTDDGLSFIFRIKRARWADGKPVTARQVAERLDATIRSGKSRNRLKPLFGSVRTVIAMTGEVIEIRLNAPQPDLLQLLAQPELAIIRGAASNGTGPFFIHSQRDGVTRLRPLLEDGAAAPEPPDANDVRLRYDPPALAAARFDLQQIALLTGGTFSDLPYARAIDPPAAQFSIDPAYGLFGLAITPQSKTMEDPALRQALAMTIDRDRIVQRFGVSRWRPVYSVLPVQLDSAKPPAALPWVEADRNERIARARALLAGKTGIPEIRIDLPAGPGGRLLLALLRADWAVLGVSVRRAGNGEAADLVLIDEVAPHSSAQWYLERLSCGPRTLCIPSVEKTVRSVAGAADLASRAERIAEADAAIASQQVYIPIALPLRWSLVRPSLDRWRTNAFAVHPLDRLRTPAG